MNRPSSRPLRTFVGALVARLDRAPRLLAVGNGVLTLGFAVGAVWLASLWNPFYVDSTRLEPLHATESRTLIDRRADVVGGELVDGTSVLQLIPLRDLEVPPVGTVERFVCVRPVLMFDLLADDASVGEVLLIARAGDRRTARTISKESGVEPLCIAISDADVFPAMVVVRLDGGRTAQPASWFASDASGPAVFPARVHPPGGEPAAGSSTAAGPIALTVTAHWTTTSDVRPRPGRDRLIDSLILSSPLLIAVGVVVALLADPAIRRRSYGKWIVRGSVGSALAGALVLTIAADAVDTRGGPLATATAGTWLGEQTPAGELVDESVVTQPVEPRLLPSGRVTGRDRLCAEVLLATYLDRENEGTVSYTLSDGSTQVSVEIDAASVSDNTWTPGCFDERANGLLDGRPLTLIVEGMDARPGRAVTAWLRPASGREAIADVRGTAAGQDHDDLVLRYRFAVASPPLHSRAVAFIGTGAIALGLTGLLVGGVAIFSGRRGSDRGRPGGKVDGP